MRGEIRLNVQQGVAMSSGAADYVRPLSLPDRANKVSHFSTNLLFWFTAAVVMNLMISLTGL